MAEASSRRVSPWIAFVAGALVAVVLTLVWTAWNRSRGVVRDVHIDAVLPLAPDLPRPDRLPDAPRIPDAPIPTSR